MKFRCGPFDRVWLFVRVMFLFFILSKSKTERRIATDYADQCPFSVCFDGIVVLHFAGKCRNISFDDDDDDDEDDADVRSLQYPYFS